jgi:hypothetical protein
MRQKNIGRKNTKAFPNKFTFFIPIIFSLSSFPIAITASTTIDAKNSFSPPISFDDSVVAAHLANKLFFSSRLLPSMLTASSLTFSIAYNIIFNI